MTDYISKKVYVENGPLEQNRININEIKKIPLLREIEKSKIENNINENEYVMKPDIKNISSNISNTSSKINYEENLSLEFNLLPNESIIEYEDKLHLRIDDQDYKGHLIITDMRVIFKQNENHTLKNYKKLPNNYAEDYYDIPIFNFYNKIEKSTDRKNPNNYQLEIQTKDNRSLKLIIENNNKKLYGALATIINPKEITNYFTPAYKYRECHPVNNDGWLKYDPLEEFKLQGVQIFNNIEEKDFRISFINKNFDLCQSYPEIIILPKNITDEDLREAASFRTKNRIPVLCYFNKDNNMTIWRSSQTRSGLTYQRNEKDEKLLNAIFEINNLNNSNNLNKNKNNNTNTNTKLIIYDARPYLNALANRFKGAGFENTDYYKNSEIVFCEIDNIHNVRNAFLKLNLIIINPKLIENKNFYSQFEASLWVNFIYQIIKSAVDIANSIKMGRPVLIHCSDGWDRSSQLTSLAQLLIEPRYRTLEGFIILIEKEWLSFGHQFGLRNGLYNFKDHSEDQRAPIFIQWLDCVHQILVQFPHLFEFNLDLLLFLAYHQTSCKYGTFLFNSEFERNDKNAKNKTVSIWTDILENKILFLNPFYRENYLQKKYLLPNFAIYKIRFWEEYFLKFLNHNSGNNFSRFYNINNNYNEIKSNLNNTSSNIDNSRIKSNILTKTKIHTNFQFIEMEKINDIITIKKQKKEIQKLNSIIKEISQKLNLKIDDFNKLSDDAKEIIKELNDGDLVEEDGYIIVNKRSSK